MLEPMADEARYTIRPPDEPGAFARLNRSFGEARLNLHDLDVRDGRADFVISVATSDKATVESVLDRFGWPIEPET